MSKTRLPLSWHYAPELAEARWVWARRDWPAFADVPGDFASVYPLLPQRCFIRGVDGPTRLFLVERGWNGVQTGVETVLDLPYSPPRSVRELIRRGRKKSEYGIYPVEKYNNDILARSRYARIPKIKFMFRSVPEGEWFGACGPGAWTAALWTTRPSPDAVHVESLIRAADAPVGTMEGLIAFVADVYAQRGFRKLSLGESPFSYPFGAKGYARMLRLFPIEAFYSARGLYRFKSKFGGKDEPVYALSRGPLLPALYNAAVAANLPRLAWKKIWPANLSNVGGVLR